MASYRALFAPIYPVTVRRCKIAGGHWGDTCLIHRKGEPRIQIRVSNELSDVAALYTLLHELGHATVWRHEAAELIRESDHDDEWSLAVGRLWRVLVDS